FTPSMKRRNDSLRWLPLICLSIAATMVMVSLPVRADPAPAQYEIVAGPRYNVELRQPQIVRDFLHQHPNVRLKEWSGLTLPVNGAQASLAMAMAANIGPDMFETDIRQAVSQGLAYPLTEWIGEDGVLKDGHPKLKPDGSRD